MKLENPPDGHTPDLEASGLARAQRDVAAKPKSGAWQVRDAFHRFSQHVSAVAGTPWAFFLAVFVVLAWAAMGPVFGYSDTWQLVINTGTTIVTFLMVFLIQNTQNRDAKAIHLKLDELIRSKRGARNTLLDLENCTDEELDAIEAEFKRLHRSAQRHPERDGDVGAVRPNHHRQ